ncbi:Ferritin 3 heavy chain homologue [Carabus blaptoides fortunei]
MAQVRQNFHKDCEDAINKQINLELYASYVYLSMAYYFDRDDIALPGMHWYFKKASDEEREHAMKFLKYQNKRGGRIILKDITAPEKKEWGTAEEAMNTALALERDVNECLLELHGVASSHGDANLCDFLETEFLQEQVDAIKEIADHVTNLKRVGEGLGVYVFDKEIKHE